MKKRKRILSMVLIAVVLASLTTHVKVLALQPTTYRLAGASRYDTSLAISKNGWDTSNCVVIATGDTFPDALCAAPLAKKYDAPIILTEKQALSNAAVQEITRLKAKEAFIVGGTGVVSTNVDNQLKNLGISFTRLAGASRFDTSVKVAEQIGTDNGVVIATGFNFPDALSIAPIAAKEGMPILLSDVNSLPSEVTAFLANKSIPRSYIVGGMGVLGPNIKSALPNAKRLAGSSRYDTNLNIIKEFESEIDFSSIYIATGSSFPDALSGSALAAKNNAAIMLSDTTVPSNTESYIKTFNCSKLYLLGGTGAISTAVENKLKGDINSENINKIDDVTDIAYLNKSYSLPKKVLATMNDGTTKLVPVSWDSNQVDTGNLASYGFQGTVDGYSTKVNLTVNVQNESSILNGNSASRNNVIYRDGYYYYSNHSTGQLCKTKEDGIGTVTFTNNYTYPEGISIIGDNTYYLDSSRNLCRINSDNAASTTIIDSNVVSYCIVDNMLYYIISSNGENNIYKMDLNTSNKVQLSNDNVNEMVVVGSQIYFTNPTDGNSIYMMNTDGSGRTKLNNEGSYMLNIYGNNIYYTSNYAIKTISVSGGDPIFVGNLKAGFVNVAGGWIYYTNYNDRYKIYKARLDGTYNTKLTDECATDLNIIGNYIYYYQDSDKLYKVAIDGTENMRFFDPISLPAPSSISTDVMGTSSIKVTWANVNESDSYAIFRSTSANGIYSYVNTVQGNITYTDTGLHPGTNYYYKVCACDSYGEGAFSDVGSGLTNIPYVYEKEPNNTLATANNYAITNNYSKTYSIRGEMNYNDVDFYKINVSGTGRLEINFTSGTDFGSNVLLGLLDSKGNVIAVGRGDNYGNIPGDLSITAGTYYLAVVLDQETNADDTYMLTAWLK